MLIIFVPSTAPAAHHAAYVLIMECTLISQAPSSTVAVLFARCYANCLWD